MKLTLPLVLLIFSISIISAFVLTAFGKSIAASAPADIASRPSSVNDSHALVTQMQWTRNIVTNQITASTVTVKNSDTASHQFKICVLANDGALQSTNAGSAANCGTTASIASGNTGSVSITFSNALANNDATLITIQETS